MLKPSHMPSSSKMKMAFSSRQRHFRKKSNSVMSIVIFFIVSGKIARGQVHIPFSFIALNVKLIPDNFMRALKFLYSFVDFVPWL